MADRKIPCADCDDCVPCEMVERCIKHDPAPKTFDNYTRLATPDGTHTEPCPVCASDPEIWQYIAKEGDVAQKVVMCGHDDEIGPPTTRWPAAAARSTCRRRASTARRSARP